MTHRLLFNYRKMNDSRLTIKGQHIVDSMTGNTSFNNPALLELVRTTLADYQASVSAAQNRDKNALALRNEKREAFRSLLDELVIYVTGAAKDNLTVLVSSGFDVAKSRSKTSQADITVAAGNSPGQVISIRKRVPGTRMYAHQFTTDPLSDTSQWTQVLTTKRKYVHTNLSHSVKYWFRVVAIGVDGQETYSDPVARTVVHQ